MRNRLVVLAALTGITLLCIICLQGYWLYSSFQEQKRRFKTDASNALATVVIKEQVGKLLLKELAVNDTARMVKMDLSEHEVNKIIHSLEQENLQAIPGIGGGQVQIKIETEDGDTGTTASEKEKLTKLLSSIAGSTNEAGKAKSAEQLAGRYRQAYADELRIRAMNVPFELALLDSKDNILSATTDKEQFRNIDLKSNVSPCSLSGTGGGMIQAGFPGINRYLLGRMAWVLTGSALLVIICLWSFCYLVLLFFREKRYAELRNDFMNNMTHELKTPISSVSVALELLQDERHPLSEASKREYFGAAQGELRRLSLLVDKVLKMAAFEKQEIHVVHSRFEAAAWMQDIIVAMGPLSSAGNAQIITEILPPDLVLYGDKTHLTNVMQNLIENAIKYNDKALPEIKVSAHEEGGQQILKVSDNGRGIPAVYLDKIFEKFFRVPSGDRHDIKGYGLGLSYVKAIVELHGGSISASSQVGAGTSFTIKIPSRA
jgi:two-component system, OmpR family, phosphate regulon sensor histidine kinase PhoR